MFFRDSTVRSTNYGFCIGNDSVNPRQKLSRSFWISKDNPVMRCIPAFCGLAIGTPSIGTNRIQKLLSFPGCRSTSESVQKGLDGFGRSIVHHLHVGKTRMFLPFIISIKRYRAKNGTLSLASASSLRSFGSEKRIIHLHQARKAISSISIRHGFAYLVSHQPRGSVLFDVKQSLHLCHRYPNLAHRHVVEQPIPFHQRRSGPVKNRSGGHARLKSTNLTVEQLSLGKVPGFFVPTPGADKPIRPSLPDKVLPASFTIRKFLLEFYQTTFFVFLGHIPTCPRIYRTFS